jgi:subtilisin family serine protease
MSSLSKLLSDLVTKSDLPDESKSILSLVSGGLSERSSSTEIKVSPVKSLSDKQTIPVIVIFKPSLAGSAQDACARSNFFAGAHGAHGPHSGAIRPDRFYHSTIKGFSSVVEADRIGYLTSHPNVMRVEIDHRIKMCPDRWVKGRKVTSVASFPLVTTPSTKGTKVPAVAVSALRSRKPPAVDQTMTAASDKPSPRPAGQVTPIVWILDTGVSIDHPDLSVHPTNCQSLLSDAKSTKVDKKAVSDDQGHGTHIAGVIASSNVTGRGVIGIAPWVEIHSIKVLDSSGDGSLSTVLAGLEVVIVEKRKNPDLPMIVNLSLGFECGTGSYNVLDEAVEQAIDLGIVVVMAAGNEAADCTTYSPAHVRRGITVGAKGKMIIPPQSTYGTYGTCGKVEQTESTQPRASYETYPQPLWFAQQPVDASMSLFSQSESKSDSRESLGSQDLEALGRKKRHHQHHHSEKPSHRSSDDDDDGLLASFTNWGECVTLFANGVDVYSTWKDKGYRRESGTSMASPYVVGVVSLYLTVRPTASPEEVKQFLMENCSFYSLSDSIGDRPPVAVLGSIDEIRYKLFGER